MARIRTVKPDLARHEGMFDAERETGLPLRFAWAMLPSICDREGRFRWRPKILQLDLLPYDGIDFNLVLDAWLKRGFIVRYRVGEDWYGWIPTFLKHQSINQREAPSKLPGPAEAEEVEDHRKQPLTVGGGGSNVHAHADTCAHVPAHGEGKGREGKGKEGNGRERKGITTTTLPDAREESSPAKSTIPADLNRLHQVFEMRSRQKGLASDHASESWDRFVNHSRSTAKLSADWEAEVNLWLSREKPRGSSYEQSSNYSRRSGGAGSSVNQVLDHCEQSIAQELAAGRHSENLDR